MGRRLLQTRAGKGLYVDSAPGIAAWVEWLPLPEAGNLDPAVALMAASTPKTASLPGGIYAPDNREAERRRLANEVLQAHGLRPRPW